MTTPDIDTAAIRKDVEKADAKLSHNSPWAARFTIYEAERRCVGHCRRLLAEVERLSRSEAEVREDEREKVAKLIEAKISEARALAERSFRAEDHALVAFADHVADALSVAAAVARGGGEAK